MTSRTHNQNTLLVGGWNSICDVCGFKYKNIDLRKRWDGLMVCKDDFETRHPSDYQGEVDYSDNPSVPWTRPDSNANTSATSVDGSAIETDNLTDTIGDEDKVLRVDGIPRMNSVQDWNTVLTANRQATFNSTSAIRGDRFTIYYTATVSAFSLSIVGAATRVILINSVTVMEYNGSDWIEISYQPSGL